MTTRTCANSRCGAALAGHRRAQTRTCSTRCRVAAHRSRQRSGQVSPIPAAMRARPRWVRHTATKVPLTPTGRPASSTDPATWSTYDAATAATAGVGLGLVLNGAGLVCLDLDHCLTATGELRPWARPILDNLPPTYIEVSPSQDGLHVWGYGHIEIGRRRQVDGGTVEVYGTGRYITVTGHPWRSAPSDLADLSATVAELT